MCSMAARLAPMIRIDALWISTEPLDMRAGTETALARVVAVFGAARPHHAYLFANRMANRLKVLVHDGIGVWLALQRRKVPDGSATAKALNLQPQALASTRPLRR